MIFKAHLGRKVRVITIFQVFFPLKHLLGKAVKDFDSMLICFLLTSLN